MTILDDHELFAESLEIALAIEGYDVRRTALPDHTRSVGSLLPAVLRSRPHIVILDLDLGQHGNGRHLIEPFAAAGIAVLVVTGSADRARWGECLRAGARRVLSKCSSLNDILATIRRIGSGLAVIDQAERDELVQCWQDESRKKHDIVSRLDQLTRREQEVLGHLVAGHQVRDIAAISVVSEATVRTQVKAILAKLEVGSQLAAVGLVHQVGWVPPSLAGVGAAAG